MSNRHKGQEDKVNKSLRDGKVVGIHRKSREEFKEKIDQIKLALERVNELYKELTDEKT